MNAPGLSNAQWFKSTYSSGQGACVEVAAVEGEIATRDSKNPAGPVLMFSEDGWAGFIRGVNAHWIKSSYSSGEGQCVEVAAVEGEIATRDSKSPTGPVLMFSEDGWAGFIRGVNAHEFQP